SLWPKPAQDRRSCAWAISRRTATSPTSATSSTPTSRWPNGAGPRRSTTSARAGPDASATCSTHCSSSRRWPSRSRSIPSASVQSTCRSSRETLRSCARISAGRLAYPSSGRSLTSWTTGGRGCGRSADVPARPRVPFPVVAALALAAVFVLTASCAGRASLAPDNRLSAWPLALAAILPGVAAWRLGAVTLGGAAAGGAVATSAAAGFGAGMVVLLGFGLVLTVAATACGRQSKERRGLAEPRRGRRGAANVLANTGIFGAIGLGAAVGHPDAVGPAV